jgi:transposase
MLGDHGFGWLGHCAEAGGAVPHERQAHRRACAQRRTSAGRGTHSTGAQFGAWLGLVPSQNSSGGKASLGRITKRGDDYLRTLLIQGAKSAVMSAHKRRDRISQWLVQLIARVGWQKAAVALANKNARILWAVLAKGRRFDANHVSLKPVESAMTETAMAG